jgi:hypothetical protein
MTAAPIHQAPIAPARPGRRRRGVLFGVLVGVLVLLVAAVIVLDGAARSYASTMIGDKVRSSLSIPASEPVDVTVGGASVLLQLLSGTLDRVDVDVPTLSIGNLSGGGSLTATGIPIDQGKPVDTLRVQFSTDQAGLQKLWAGLTGLPANTVALVNGAIQVSTSVTVFGRALPVGISFTPAAKSGELQLTPTSVKVSGQTLTAAQLKTTLGSVGASLLDTRQLCIANQLPSGFTLDRVTVSGSTLSLSVAAKQVAMSTATFTSKGTCPAA